MFEVVSITYEALVTPWTARGLSPVTLWTARGLSPITPWTAKGGKRSSRHLTRASVYRCNERNQYEPRSDKSETNNSWAEPGHRRVGSDRLSPRVGSGPGRAGSRRVESGLMWPAGLRPGGGRGSGGVGKRCGCEPHGGGNGHKKNINSRTGEQTNLFVSGDNILSLGRQ